MTNGADPNALQSLERSLRVIETLRDLNGARVTELGEELEMAKSTVYKHLYTLMENGYVVKEGDQYFLGLRFSSLGEYAMTRKASLVKAREMARELSQETDLESGFIVEENGRGSYLKTEPEGTTHRHLGPRIGQPVYLHSSAAGKAILAELPDERVAEVIDRWGLPAETDATITDSDALFDELERIRERGYAFNNGENKPGIRAVGVGVKDADRTVLGGVSLTVPEYRAEDTWFTKELPRQVMAKVESFESSL